jgi:demethylmenaquinone methyltransferase/2-methoxy-6-polyprenyl-1,4-benzoquinol methylase/phosphoethanolamine N-methyltransferase
MSAICRRGGINAMSIGLHRKITKHMREAQPVGPGPETTGRVIRWAHRYDAVVNLLTLGKARALRRATIELAHIQSGDRVLDVGCGTGDLTLAAKAWAGSTSQVCGIDAGSEMIEVARQKAARASVDVDFRVDLVERISFPDESFDVVLSSMMMHHLPGDLKRQALAEIRRVLKSGGHLLIIDAKRPTSRIGQVLTALPLHKSMGIGVQDLPAIMKEAGFVDTEAGDTSFRPLGFVRGRKAISGSTL